MSATTIIDTASLGALIRYTDVSPKPPARFTKKLAVRERSNGVDRLVKKEPPRVYRPMDYIEFLYNPQRKHARNGMLSSIAF